MLIVGGVAGGASAAARLRRLDEHCKIILFERGEHISFANCGLPYYIGEVITDKEKLLVRTPTAMKRRFNKDVRIFSEVVSLDPKRKKIKVRDLNEGKEYSETYDKLILSPGASPIVPRIEGADAPNVCTLRSVPDTFAINEKVLTRCNIPYEKSFTHSASHAGYYPGAMPISLKLIFSPEDGKILGAQAVGYEGVEKRIDVIATAMRAGMTVLDLEKLELSYAPPFSSAKDPVNMAGYVAANILKGDVAIVHWDEIDKLDKDKSILVDVRTEIEYSLGTIDGAVNIPVDDLRERINELPADKEIIIFCQVGLRGYLACRILTQRGYQNVRNLSGGYKTYLSAVQRQLGTDIHDHKRIDKADLIHASAPSPESCDGAITIKLDACGLQCPGPIIQVNNTLNFMNKGELLEITASDPGFGADIKAWCERTGNHLTRVTKEGKNIIACIKKGTDKMSDKKVPAGSASNDKTMVVFSGELDKAIASFIIANGAAAMGRKVTMFFTFWGLNILRKHDKVKVKKDFLESMFGMMMPRGSKRLTLSKMNMGGMGGKMIRHIMNKKNVASLEDLIEQAKSQGIKIVACSMSMDVMGIKQEELVDGIEIGGVTSYLAAAESADTNLFI